MRNPIEPASATYRLPSGAASVAAAPIRLSLDGVPVHERPGIYREFFGRTVFRLDVEPLRDVPFAVDVRLQNLPDLQVLVGKVHGSCNRRTREMLADGSDHCSLMV